MSKLKDVIIIDPWLNFADFANNVEQKFLGEYSQFFKFSEGTKLRLVDLFDECKIKMSEDIIEAVKEKYPQFLIKKN